MRKIGCLIAVGGWLAAPNGWASPGLSEAVFRIVPRPGGAHAVSKFLRLCTLSRMCGVLHATMSVRGAARVTCSPTRVKKWTARTGTRPIRLDLQIFAERKSSVFAHVGRLAAE